MSSKSSLHLNAEDLVTIFIRYSVVLQTIYTLQLFLVSLAGLGKTISPFIVNGNDVSRWPFYFDAGQAAVQIFLFCLLFTKAHAVARFIVGESKELSFEGDPKSWTAMFLQLTGITLVVQGLASSGLLVTDYIHTQQLGNLYQTDPHYARTLLEMIVKIAAGLLFVFNSSAMAHWLNSKR
jgi:hypothetical protein